MGRGGALLQQGWMQPGREPESRRLAALLEETQICLLETRPASKFAALSLPVSSKHVSIKHANTPAKCSGHFKPIMLWLISQTAVIAEQSQEETAHLTPQVTLLARAQTCKGTDAQNTSQLTLSHPFEPSGFMPAGYSALI